MMDSARKGTAPLSHKFGDQGSWVLFEENVRRTNGMEGALGGTRAGLTAASLPSQLYRESVLALLRNRVTD